MNGSRLRLVAGLGNPGENYRHTRHNVGFCVLDRIAASYSIPFTFRERDAVFGRGAIHGIPVVLAKPMAYMNRSGLPLIRLSEKFGISNRDLVVIHDDLDLAFGRLKIKEKGGDGGHRGVRSIIDAFGSGEFTRVRVGIGRSETGMAVVDYVLTEFSPEEAESLDEVISRTRDAVVTILCKGTKDGMNQFNTKRTEIIS